jgi:hypothetical protein
MVKVSAGSHMNASFGTPASTEPLEIDMTYSLSIVEGFSTDDDNVVAVAYNPADGNCVIGYNRANAGSLRIAVPNSWNGEEVHVYGFVIGSEAGSVPTARPTDATQVSETFYCGKVTIS